MSNTHFVYILQSSDERYYVGYTTNLMRRMQEHKSGKGSKFVRGFGFKKLLYYEAYSTKSKALRREAEIKRWSRTQKEMLVFHLSQGFPFVASPQARILILGSMPGKRSLQEQQYYAHPHNIFWDIMGDLFGASRNKPYSERLRILKKHHVALWDVVFQCRRQGSLDTNIHMASVIPNDFVSLFARCPHIDTVFFNGHKAEQLFRKRVLPHLLQENGAQAQSLQLLRLPSTSPAHAALSKEQKKGHWRQRICHLRRGET